MCRVPVPRGHMGLVFWNPGTFCPAPRCCAFPHQVSFESLTKDWAGGGIALHFSSGGGVPFVVTPLCRLTGQLVYPVHVREGPNTLYSSISEANVTIHSVAASACPAYG